MKKVILPVIIAICLLMQACSIMPAKMTEEPTRTAAATAEVKVTTVSVPTPVPTPKPDPVIALVCDGEKCDELFKAGVEKALTDTDYKLKEYDGGLDAVKEITSDINVKGIVAIVENSKTDMTPLSDTGLPTAVYSTFAGKAPSGAYYVSYKKGDGLEKKLLDETIAYPPHDTPVRLLAMFTKSGSDGEKAYNTAIKEGRVFDKGTYKNKYPSESTASEATMAATSPQAKATASATPSAKASIKKANKKAAASPSAEASKAAAPATKSSAATSWVDSMLTKYIEGMLDAIYTDDSELAVAAAKAVAKAGRNDLLEVMTIGTTDDVIACMKENPEVLALTIGENRAYAGYNAASNLKGIIEGGAVPAALTLSSEKLLAQWLTDGTYGIDYMAKKYDPNYTTPSTPSTPNDASEEG